MSVYTYPLFVGAVTSSGQLLYTGPAGTRTILIDAELLNVSPNAQILALYVQLASGAAATIVRYNAVPTQEWRQWTGRVVLDPGDTLHAVADQNNAQFIATGYQFPL